MPNDFGFVGVARLHTIIPNSRDLNTDAQVIILTISLSEAIRQGLQPLDYFSK